MEGAGFVTSTAGKQNRCIVKPSTRPGADILLAAGQGHDGHHQTDPAAGEAAAPGPAQSAGLDPADPCWAYWDGQQQQVTLPKQTLWVT